MQYLLYTIQGIRDLHPCSFRDRLSQLHSDCLLSDARTYDNKNTEYGLLYALYRAKKNGEKVGCSTAHSCINYKMLSVA